MPAPRCNESGPTREPSRAGLVSDDSGRGQRHIVNVPIRKKKGKKKLTGAFIDEVLGFA